MGHGLASELDHPAGLSVVPEQRVEAELNCMMCGRTVGEIVNGRAIQHRGCRERLRIDRGVLRCCHCGGTVYREALMGTGLGLPLV